MRSTVLREFWFPLLLSLAGLPFALIGIYVTSANGRRLMFTVAATLLFLAVLSFIWGDPVRGPFAFIVHPTSPEEFSFQAGVRCSYPVKQLMDGIDFSKCMKMPGQPIQLWVRKTWWAGLNVRMTLMGSESHAVLVYEDKEVKYLDGGFDLNHDDYALELVSATGAPIFQLIVADDYRVIYMNAIISTGPQSVMVLKDNRAEGMPIQQANRPENKLGRIFRYPSYMHQGERG